ncbi:MAG: 3-methyl-2-oxobutanoate hydroxymethyltransferase [Thermomicrobiales bacterium]|nr:3-methyl-2-oxobutanoate hydroxymethyltransferase [Thermomicrobiales bacterium]
MTASGDREPQPAKKLTIPEIRARRGGVPLAMVTAYDYPTARLAEEAGIDLILVGDSLGMVVLGYDSTVPVTLDDIVHHCRAVVRGAPRTHVVADLPFLTYAIDDARTIEHAGRLIQEGGADAVKIEGGRDVAPRIAALVRAGIPTMGHVGLLPQRVGELGGFKVQGRDIASARALLDDAAAVAEAGAYAMVVEAVPAELAARLTERASIPTIGIGAGAACDGQVLVSQDLLGFEQRTAPRFVKRYAELGAAARSAYAAYAADVRSRTFPGPAQSYRMPEDALRALEETIG